MQKSFLWKIPNNLRSLDACYVDGDIDGFCIVQRPEAKVNICIIIIGTDANVNICIIIIIQARG